MSVFFLLRIVHILAELAIGMTVVVLLRLPSLSPRDGLLVQARS
ncbi:MAG: hypothetical protein VKI63_09625 [Cyanobium sp.]|nr:hypothetical protein [Cyanobium sp.]